MSNKDHHNDCNAQSASPPPPPPFLEEGRTEVKEYGKYGNVKLLLESSTIHAMHRMLMLFFARDRLSSGIVAADWPLCLDVTDDWHVKNRWLLFAFIVVWFSLS